jgi:hypothetical protein
MSFAQFVFASGLVSTLPLTPKQVSRLPGAVEVGAQDCANTTPEHIEKTIAKIMEYASAVMNRVFGTKRRVAAV